MVYVPRKFVYPTFVIFFAITIILLVFVASATQNLDVSDFEYAIIGEEVVVSMGVKNTSNHVIRDISILILSKDNEKTSFIEELVPGEKERVEISLGFSSDLFYEIFIKAPYNRTIYDSFVLEESTIRPVTVEVQITDRMKVGEVYPLAVKLCNISGGDLLEVNWSESVEGDYFEEKFYPRKISLRVNECENLNSTLTPITPGIVKMEFNLRVGLIEKRLSHEIIIEPEG